MSFKFNGWNGSDRFDIGDMPEGEIVFTNRAFFGAAPIESHHCATLAEAVLMARMLSQQLRGLREVRIVVEKAGGYAVEIR